jgi:hypothetical protein
MPFNDSISPILFPPVPPVDRIHPAWPVIIKQNRFKQGAKQLEELVVRLQRRRLNPRRSNPWDFSGRNRHPGGFDAVA